MTKAEVSVMDQMVSQLGESWGLPHLMMSHLQPPELGDNMLLQFELTGLGLCSSSVRKRTHLALQQLPEASTYFLLISSKFLSGPQSSVYFSPSFLRGRLQAPHRLAPIPPVMDVLHHFEAQTSSL